MPIARSRELAVPRWTFKIVLTISILSRHDGFRNFVGAASNRTGLLAGGGGIPQGFLINPRGFRKKEWNIDNGEQQKLIHTN